MKPSIQLPRRGRGSHRGAVLALVVVTLTAACGATSSPGDPTPEPSSDSASPRPASSATDTSPSTAAEPSGATTGGGDVAACELLSDEDILELTGWEIESAEAGAVLGVYESGCEWTLAGGSTDGLPAEITLGVVSPGGRSYFDTYIAPYAADYGAEPLEGVGDIGLIGGVSGTATAVMGDLLADLQWVDFGGAGRDVAIALLQRVLANGGG